MRTIAPENWGGAPVERGGHGGPRGDPEAAGASNKVDLRVGLGGLTGNWEVAAIVKNITDEHTSHSWNPAVYGMGSYTSVTDRGRQIAVQGIYKW